MKEFIIDSQPNEYETIDEEKINSIESNLLSNNSITSEDANYLLGVLCYKIRKMFYSDIKDATFENKCDVCISIAYHYLNSLKVNLHSAQTQHTFYNDYIIGHSFLTAEINIEGKNAIFLIDPSYRQFFTTDKCSKDYSYINKGVVLRTPHPGYYVAIDNKDKENSCKKISEFLKDGYGLLDPYLAKIYSESFLNTKTNTGSLSHSYIDGRMCINEFLKQNERISKTQDELLQSNMLILPSTNNKSL